jgi:leucyl-tRNA synthetase
MNPVMPHLVSECLAELDPKMYLEWPAIDHKKILNMNFNIVVQINGKKRAIINLGNEISESELILKIKEDPLINKFIKNKEFKKTIYIKNKLINLII